jgi:hypothetical protein
MKSSTFLTLFLYFDTFVMGALAAVAIRHAYAHFRPHEPEKHHPASAAQNGHLPPEVRQHLLEAAQTKFQAVLDRSAVELEKDLTMTSLNMNKRLDKLGEEVVGREMQRYHEQLEELRKKTDAITQSAQAEVDTHQTDLKAKLEVEMEAEKQHLLQQIDTKLADAVASFLTETLQHNVDLGAPSAYLVSVLEEHKADFTKEVADENQTTK